MITDETAGDEPRDTAFADEVISIEGLILEWGDQIAGSFGEGIRVREHRRWTHLFDIITRFRPELSGLSRVRDRILWLTAFGLDPDVTSLLCQSAVRIVDSLDRILSADGSSPVDEARWLMEAEYLLHEFAADPSAVSRWRDVPPHVRPQQFGFGVLRRRHEQRLGIPEDHVHASRGQYRLHSRSVHPVPVAEVPPHVASPGARYDMLYAEIGDLLGHAYSVYRAAFDYAQAVVETLEPKTDIADPPPLDDFERAEERRKKFHQRHGLPETLPREYHQRDDGRRTRLPDGNWVHLDSMTTDSSDLQ